MGLFSRRRDEEEPERVEAAPEEPPHSGRGASRGPWDVEEVPDLGPRVDLGALRVPGRQGMQLRIEMDPSGERPIAVNLALGSSALQVQAFAAPRTSGIWDELRSEIAMSVTRQGGTADEAAGPFGTELLARLPVRTPEGRTGHRPTRFLGVDGPRWFLRGVLSGEAAVKAEAASELEEAFADIVVVRGLEARPPRALLPVQLPELPGQERGKAGAAQDASLEVLRRGPEITETR